MYAMKYMNKRRCLEKEAVENVIREIKILSSLDHPFIVNLKFSFQDEEDMFIVTDLMLGGDLHYHISHGVQFSEESIRFYLCQLMLAIDYLQSKRIVHRDIKPANILLDEKGYLYLSDFNVATVISDTDTLNSPSGTLAYIAPEVFAVQTGARDSYGLAVDWWSTGVVAVELCTGTNPFNISSSMSADSVLRILNQARRYPVTCHRHFKQVLHKLLCVDPETRLTDLNSAKQLEFFQDVDFDSVLSKSYLVPFRPPCNSLNYDPTHELEEMIIESHPLHKKKKRLQKQRSLREGLATSATNTPAGTLQNRLEQMADDFVVYDREKEQAKSRQLQLEEDWERELCESMHHSQPISQVDLSVIQRIRKELVEQGGHRHLFRGGSSDRARASQYCDGMSSRSVRALDVEGLQQTEKCIEKDNQFKLSTCSQYQTSSHSTPSRKCRSRRKLMHHKSVN